MIILRELHREKRTNKRVGNRVILIRELHRWKREDSYEFQSLSQRTDI